MGLLAWNILPCDIETALQIFQRVMDEGMNEGRISLFWQVYMLRGIEDVVCHIGDIMICSKTKGTL